MKKTEKNERTNSVPTSQLLLVSNFKSNMPVFFLHQKSFATFFNLCILLVWHTDTGSTVKSDTL
jgi:hypothetical protein